jgi:Ala-tRNA(Pro) deacylase
LGVEPGSVSLLAIVNDQDNTVEVFVDRTLWSSDAFQFHPLVNTSTLVISKEGIEKFCGAAGHEVRVIDVPEQVGGA